MTAIDAPAIIANVERYLAQQYAKRKVERRVIRLTALVMGQRYRVEVRYSDGVNTLEPYILFVCDR